MPIISPKIIFHPQSATLPNELIELVTNALMLITTSPDQLNYTTTYRYLHDLPTQSREIINYLDPGKPVVLTEKYYHSEMIATVRFAHYHLYTLLSSYIEDITNISNVCVKEIRPILKFTRLHHYELALTFTLHRDLGGNKIPYAFRPIIQMNLDYRCSGFCRERIEHQAQQGKPLIELIRYSQPAHRPMLRAGSPPVFPFSSLSASPGVDSGLNSSIISGASSRSASPISSSIAAFSALSIGPQAAAGSIDYTANVKAFPQGLRNYWKMLIYQSNQTSAIKTINASRQAYLEMQPCAENYALKIAVCGTLPMTDETINNIFDFILLAITNRNADLFR